MQKMWGYVVAAWRFLWRHGRLFWLIAGILFGMLFNIMPMIMMIMGGMGGGGGMPKFPTAVEVALVAKGTLDDTVTVAGSLHADEGTTLRSEVNGKVSALPLNEGDTVDKGSLLIVLDDATTRANLAQARAQANLAARNLDRLKKLRAEDPELVSQKDFDNAVSAHEVAAASVQVAQAAYDKTHIVAPFAGTVGLRRVNVGDYVSPGQELVSLQSLDVMKADFDLPERFARTLQPGMPVKLTVDALGGTEVSATVLAADPHINPATRTVAVRARVDNSARQLRPGMFVRAAATLVHRANALTIPEEAIVPEGNATFVYKVVDKHAVKTSVQVGGRAGGVVEIVSGLAAGDMVITGGTVKVHDGGEVVLANIAPASDAVSPSGVSAPLAPAASPTSSPSTPSAVSPANPLMPAVSGRAAPSTPISPSAGPAVRE